MTHDDLRELTYQWIHNLGLDNYDIEVKINKSDISDSEVNSDWATKEAEIIFSDELLSKRKDQIEVEVVRVLASILLKPFLHGEYQNYESTDRFVVDNLAKSIIRVGVLGKNLKVGKIDLD